MQVTRIIKQRSQQNPRPHSKVQPSFNDSETMFASVEAQYRIPEQSMLRTSFWSSGNVGEKKFLIVFIGLKDGSTYVVIREQLH